MNSRKVIVVGASSGIGEALALAFASRGDQVALVARREDHLQNVAARIDDRAGRKLAHIYPFDVTDFDATPSMFSRITSDLGGLDVIVYCAGVMPHVAVDEYDFAKDQSIVNVNVLGAIAWCSLAAERFAKLGTGMIVGIGSIAGDRGRRGFPAYSASKAALDTYLEGLRNRLGRRGATVLTVRAGLVDTVMTRGMKTPIKTISAEAAAQQILAAIDRKDLVVYVPPVWRWVGRALKLIPSRIMQRINI